MPLASAVPYLVAEIVDTHDSPANEDGEGDIGPTRSLITVTSRSLLVGVGEKIQEYETSKAASSAHFSIFYSGERYAAMFTNLRCHGTLYLTAVQSAPIGSSGFSS